MGLAYGLKKACGIVVAAVLVTGIWDAVKAEACLICYLWERLMP